MIDIYTDMAIDTNTLIWEDKTLIGYLKRMPYHTKTYADLDKFSMARLQEYGKATMNTHADKSYSY